METVIRKEDSVEKRTELFNRYVLPNRNLVYKLCIEYSWYREEIEDNYNEVLVNFFKYMETYDPARSIQTWLHIVTKRFINDLNHRSAAFKRDDDVDVSLIPIPDESEAGENCMGIDNYHLFYSDDILAVLNEMKPIYREALLLQQAGYKLNEIMEISYRNGNLKIKNLETVKSRLFLAKQQMKKLIDRNGKRKKD